MRLKENAAVTHFATGQRGMCSFIANLMLFYTFFYKAERANFVRAVGVSATPVAVRRF